MWNIKEMSQLDATLDGTFDFDLDIWPWIPRSNCISGMGGETPEANFFKLHMLDLWVWENFLAPISVTLGQGH